MSDKTPTETGTGNYEVGYKKPPKEHQYGQPGANPMNPGGWKKADTPRYKMEQMLKLTNNELTGIANDTNAPLFERRIAQSLLKENDFKTTERIINQVYGMPRSAAPEGTIQKPKAEPEPEPSA